MPIDPSTGLWESGPSSPNPGAFAGVAQMLNAPRAAELASRSDYESLLAEHMKELQLQEAQNKYSRQVGYQGAMSNLSDEYNQSVTSGTPMSASDISTKAIIAGLPYGEPGGSQSLGMAAAFGNKTATAGAAATRAQAAVDMAAARGKMAQAMQTGDNAKMIGVLGGMDKNVGDTIRILHAQGIDDGLQDDERAAILKDPNLSSQPFDPAAHQKVIHLQNLDTVQKLTADARMISAKAQATIDQAKAAVLKNAPTKDTAISAAQRSVDTLKQHILEREKLLGTLGTAAGMSDDLKGTLKSEVDNMKQDLMLRQKNLEDLRALRVQSSTDRAGGAGTQSVVAPTQTAKSLFNSMITSGQLPGLSTPPPPAQPGQ